MKNSHITAVRYIAPLLLVSFLSAPALAAAQTSTTSNTATSTNGWGGGGYPGNGQGHEFGQLPAAAQQTITQLDTMATSSVLMPVLFGVGVQDISPNFGDPRDNGTRTHEGEDIMAVKGTPIVSPTEAVVLKTEVGASEGNAVYTINPGGETFVYMHLEYFGEGVTAGEVLQTGSLIGYVGDTGDAAGGPSHLHLEIHNPAGVPTDPFPRLTLEFPLSQKINYLTNIFANPLVQTASSTDLATLLVTNFRSTFTDALAANIALPQQITTALATVPPPSVIVSSSGSTRTLPSGDLDVGSTGAAVTTLQQYLIQAASGPGAARLATAGATGTFGPLTQLALAEYQTAMGISPASGYYGPLTRAYVTAHPLSGVGTAPTSVTTAPANTSAPAVSGATTTLTRD